MYHVYMYNDGRRTFYQKVLDNIMIQQLKVVMANPVGKDTIAVNYGKKVNHLSLPLLQILFSPSEKVVCHSNLGIQLK